MSGINIFGDSNVAGSVESWKDTVFPANIAWAQRLRATYENVHVDGVAGRTLFSSINQYIAMQQYHPAAITIICIGANDLYYGSTANYLYADLTKIINATPGHVIYLRHPGVYYSTEDLYEYRRIDYIRREQEFFTLVPHVNATIAIPPKCTIGMDRWHFSETGHAIVYDLLVEQLRRLLPP